MWGVLRKTVRELWLVTFLFSMAFLVVEILLNLVLPQILGQFRVMLLQMPFLSEFLGALLGLQIEGEITARLLAAVVWVHPVVLAILWAHAILVCTRFPVAEIDRGTIDVLLSLPVSRRAIYLCETIGWLASGLILLTAGGVGYAIGSQAMEAANRPELDVVVLTLFNLLCVYLAVGGLAFLVSSLSERRGRAVSVVFGLVLASFLISFLAQYWEPAQHFAFLSLLDYYRPAAILRSGAVPTSDIVALLAVAGGSWIAGCEITARRSICTT